MNDIFEKGNKEKMGSEEELQNYKMITTDIRFLLREYLDKNDPEFLKMMCQSLGLEIV